MHTECLGLVCRECGKRIPEAECALSCPDCGAPMRVMFSEASFRQALSAGLPAPEGRSFLRQWRSILPISDESLIDRVSLGEAETPLLPSHRYGEKLGIPDLYFKVEQGPTLSLKDRGTALCVLKALEFGCKTVCLSSSGNNAASVSAYGSRAGLNPVVFVQKHVSAAKIFKSLVYGGARGPHRRRHGRRQPDLWGNGQAPQMVPVWRPKSLPHRREAYLCLRHRPAAWRAPDTVLIPCGGGARDGRRA